MRPPAYLLMTVTKIIPEKVWEVVQICEGQEYRLGCQEIQGLRQSLLVESQDEPGRLIWLSTWDRMADSQAFLGSPAYAGLMADLQLYFLRLPEWYWYSLLKELDYKHSQPGRRKEEKA